MAEDRELQMQKIGESILTAARSELCLHMRFLNLPLSSLRYVNSPGIRFLGTDGNGLYFDPEVLVEGFLSNPVFINRMYLHVVLHCIFRHLFKPHRENKAIWNLSCDIAMEYIIDELRYRCVKYPATKFRLAFYDNLKLKFKVPTAEKIYGLLMDLELTPFDQERLETEFRKDDHSLWPDGDLNPKPETQALEQKWKDISEKMQTDMDTFSKEEVSEMETFKEEVRVENRNKYDYSRFLRKFAVIREEPVMDLDSYDITLYTYGMQLYGNMPLVEPQETKETKKIEEFVIAIDTSLSCSGDLVREFMEHTYSVLKESESYFRKINIHIIQCDEDIRSDKKITSQEELKEYMENLELIGRGGTDFRPVFDYVNQLIKDKVFKSLRGLIYFTDGQGVFPKAKPSYDTAFAFLSENYEDTQVPPWAIKLIIEPEDLKQRNHNKKDKIINLPEEDNRGV